MYPSVDMKYGSVESFAIEHAPRRRKSDTLLGRLMSLPWHVSVLFGEFAFVALKWILPALWSSNLFLKPIVLAFSGMAWLFSGIFLLIGAVVFAAQNRRRLGQGRRATLHFLQRSLAGNARRIRNTLEPRSGTARPR